MLAQFYAPIVGGEERMTQSLAAELVGARPRGRGGDAAPAGPAPLRGARRDPRAPAARVRAADRAAVQRSGRRHAPPAPDPETVIALRRVIARERPTVVHGHNWLAHAFLPLRRSTAAAYVLSLHDYSLLCSTKRMMLHGEPCSGPGPRSAPAARPRTMARDRPARSHWRPALSGGAQRRLADLFLPVSNEVGARCGLAAKRLPYEVVPNFSARPGPRGGRRISPAVVAGRSVHPLRWRRDHRQGRRGPDRSARAHGDAGAAGAGRTRERRSARRGAPDVISLGLLRTMRCLKPGSAAPWAWCPRSGRTPSRPWRSKRWRPEPQSSPRGSAGCLRR